MESQEHITFRLPLGEVRRDVKDPIALDGERTEDQQSQEAIHSQKERCTSKNEEQLQNESRIEDEQYLHGRTLSPILEYEQQSHGQRLDSGNRDQSQNEQSHSVIEPQTREEQLASVVVPEEEPNSDGEKCELHVYERRYDTRGEEVVLRAGTRSHFVPPKPKSHRACLILTRKYDHDGRFLYSELEVQSRVLIKAFKDVIGDYGGVDFDSKCVIIQEPPRCLFHYQSELKQHAEASENPQLKSHMELCLQYVERTLHREIKIFDSFMSSTSWSFELEHCHLWMAFKPGCLIYLKSGSDSDDYVTRLRFIEAEEVDDSYEVLHWFLNMEHIAHVGGEIGLTHETFVIDQYEGCKSLRELDAIPLHLHPDNERIQRDFTERGRKFLSLCGVHHCYYDGAAQMYLKKVHCPGSPPYTNVRHRIMLDLEQYDRKVADTGHRLVPDAKTYSSGTEALANLSDEDIMLCCHSLPGFSLELKIWGSFSVNKIKEVAYNDLAFQGLVLPEKKKMLISSLLELQDNQIEDTFDDLIQGKGKGLVFLLHGPPGVGKTYTAESIADHTRRPLLRLSSAELIGSGTWVEQRLSNLFLLAAKWNGVILIDEADVFMQERTLDNLERNQLVSTLLRVLEYYEGILFLTTNRAETIDPAFKSRIHLSIAYPPLSTKARRELWMASIARANRGQQPAWLTTEFLDSLAKKEINGREIKNVVRMGCFLARNAKRSLNSADVLQSFEAWEQFENDFNE